MDSQISRCWYKRLPREVQQIYLKTGIAKANPKITKGIEWYRVSAKLGFPTAELWLKVNGY